MSNWKLISTAPKDRPIIVKGGYDDILGDYLEYNEDSDDPIKEAKEAFGEFAVRLMREPTRVMWDDDRWYIGFYDSACGAIHRKYPTHWKEIDE